MPLEDLPNGFTVPTRNEIRDQFQKNYALRLNGAPTGEGSQAYIDGSVIADTLAPVYANAVSIGRGASLDDMTREQLKAECRALGIPEELPESAGAGFVIITASAGGVFIDAGRQIKDESRNLTLRCAVPDTYYDGRAVPIIGVDKGPATNVPAGTRLKWQNPPAGLGNIATVQEDADGNGLTGGRAAESDDDIKARIRSARKDSPAGGNVAQIRELVKEAGRALGIAVQDVFVYPAVTSAGHYAYVFTLRPGDPGSSRIPTAIQIAAVRAYVHGALPEDDGILAAEIIEEEITIKLGVKWAPKAEGWVDAAPWPAFADAFYVSAVTSALAFDVETLETTYTAPQVGQTFAFYDDADRVYRRKRILTVVDNGGGNYSLTIDDTNNASDVAYLPSVNEAMCPYAPSLDLLVEPILTFSNSFGPGEQVEEFFDEGYRQKRMPENPTEWPSELRHKAIDSVDDLPQIYDVDILSPDLPYIPAVGVAGVSSNILAVASILAFPL